MERRDDEEGEEEERWRRQGGEVHPSKIKGSAPL